MIDLRKNEIVIVDGLKNYLSVKNRPCEVVRQNQIVEVPAYPYVSYNQTALLPAHRGTYCEAEDGTLYADVTQTWSFTVQSDDQDEAMALALRMYNFFSAVGVQLLADNDIVVRRVGGVTTRDNLLSIEYEHRNGLDVTFGLLNIITEDEQIFKDVIETYTTKEE